MSNKADLRARVMLPMMFINHPSMAVAFDARSHADAVLRKAGFRKYFPAFSFLAPQISPPSGPLRFAPACGAHRFPACPGTIIATTKEE
ncbi:hypothetical protein [Mesorhizobium sp.]|uniref:hypothetical protein n=1 Tax=Mesorhizobium sp. TaxID=1871066 RepID=UPI000FE9B612|nr:hypothetical protein [Mesorhizobium sp.]RWA84874.1 MAG: hypothetical protein EOQ32_26465 [Mesorhizobium sp.]